MVKCRAILSFVLLLVWTAAPALACLPTSTMTQAEMECCKKMAGDCHMGARNHPCCEKSANQPEPVATLQKTHVLHAVFTVAMSVVQTTDLPTLNVEHHGLALGLPPPSPPNLSSILRI
jgi:hypothetical protein